jgi:hypothetical protein
MASNVERPYDHRHCCDARNIWFNPNGEAAARELRALPLVEREQVWADLSGKATTTYFRKNLTEDSEMVEEKIQELEQHLVAIPNKPALDMAQTSNPEYVNSRSFRLMFLRAWGFENPQLAAECMVQHFEVKMELFGKDKLGRNIRLSDFEEGDDPKDLEVVQCGFGQVLLGTDRGGRVVLLTRPSLMNSQSWKSIVSKQQSMIEF